ncbi:MAG: hypothetical protein HY619_07025 [Thaumarchaeota archaeon]|nr:hypothetical protein [Nitrososphaerota archaeon]
MVAKSLDVLRRREQVQSLMARGLSALEIHGSVDPKVSLKTIRRDMAWIQRQEEQWWRENTELRTRMKRYFKRRLSAMTEITKEAWLALQDAGRDVKLRIGALNAILGAERAMTGLLGFTGITALDIEVQEKIAQVDQELAELRKLARIAHDDDIQP